MAKAEKVEQFQYEWDDEGQVLTVATKDGKLKQDFDFSKTPAEIDQNYLLMGRRTAIGNAAAGSGSDKAAALERMRAKFDQHMRGEWSGGREKNPEWMRGRTKEITAIGLLLGKDPMVVRQDLRECTEAEGLKFLNSDSVKQKMREMASAATRSLESLL